MSSDPRAPRAFRTATVDQPHAPTSQEDPLRLCVHATVVLVAWLVTPPLALALFGAIGVRGYVRARRAGLLTSRCKLGDTRLVIAYLAALTVAGAVATVWRLVDRF